MSFGFDGQKGSNRVWFNSDRISWKSFSILGELSEVGVFLFLSAFFCCSRKARFGEADIAEYPQMHRLAFFFT